MKNPMNRQRRGWMAIAPIDLQAIFSQVDKVGKTQAAQKDGQALHQAIQGVQIQRKTEELIQQVNETQDTGEGAEKINDRTAKQNNDSKKQKKENDNSDENEEEKKPAFIRDPSLGNRIDISY